MIAHEDRRSRAQPLCPLCPLLTTFASVPITAPESPRFPLIDNVEPHAGGEVHRVFEPACNCPLGKPTIAYQAEGDGREDAVGCAEDEAAHRGEDAGPEIERLVELAIAWLVLDVWRRCEGGTEEEETADGGVAENYIAEDREKAHFELDVRYEVRSDGKCLRSRGRGIRERLNEQIQDGLQRGEE